MDEPNPRQRQRDIEMSMLFIVALELAVLLSVFANQVGLLAATLAAVPAGIALGIWHAHV